MKHINTYSNISEFNNNFDNIDSPSVSYIKDEDRVVFRGGYRQPTEDKTKAQVGDLVFFNDMIYNDDIEGDKLLYMDPKDPKASMMIVNDVCYGIVVIPTSHTNDGTVRVVSLDFMDYNNPQHGSNLPVPMMWGDPSEKLPNLPAIGRIIAYASGTTTTYLETSSYFASDYELVDGTINSISDKSCRYTSYAENNTIIPSPYAEDGGVNSVYFSNTSSILNQGLVGKENTKAIIDSIEYESGGSITNTEDNYPAARCCYSYKSDDEDIQNAGYYYLPSIAEFGYLVARYKEINFARRVAGRVGLINRWYWTSSLMDTSLSWYVYLGLDGNFGRCGGYDMGNYDGYKSILYSVLAFVAF